MTKSLRHKAPKQEPLRSAKIQISIPSGPQWYAQFAMCVIQSYTDALIHKTPGWKIEGLTIKNSRGSLIHKQRADMIRDAIKENCTHVFFVDTDQVFPANTIRRMLWHSKEIVAANVAIKQLPSISTARKKESNGRIRPIFTTGESSGLEKVWRIGTGIMLIDLSVIPKIEKPWFQVSSSDDAGEEHGEDWWFCQQLEKAGIDLWIDHDLSWEVGHIGALTYNHWHVPETIIAEEERMYNELPLEESAKEFKKYVDELTEKYT